MPEILAKVPFIRLLFPLVIGILAQYYLHISHLSFVFLYTGIVLIALSYFIHPLKQYKYRWIFGTGCFLFLFTIGAGTTVIRQNNSSFDFKPQETAYQGTIVSIPEYKEKSIACKVDLTNNKAIMCYFQKGVRSKELGIGDEIIFNTRISRFKHFATSTEFDYPRYMYNKGISGSTYLYSDDWEASGRNLKSLQSIALEYRLSLLDFYHSLNLSETEYSILSALTLGYKDALTDDLQQSFRTTGTAHILAVSGMHTAIIFGVIVSIFSLFFRNPTRNRIIQLFIIICLWIYAFITGFSPSVVRACIMLSIFCFGNIFNRKGFVYNNILIAAFLMLIYNPFWLFDVGFQLSFAAVLSICFFQPHISALLKIKNKYIKSVWELFCLSIAAQIGTFPICLYYFGSFPTYFFVTNLLIVPLVAVIIYLTVAIFITHALSLFMFQNIFNEISGLLVIVLKFVIGFMTETIRFFERIPLALIDNINIPLATTLLLIFTITLFCVYLSCQKIRILQTALCFTIFSLIGVIIPPRNTLSIYQNQTGYTIKWNFGHSKFNTDSVREYKLIQLGDKKLLSIARNPWIDKQSPKPFQVDYLHIVKNDSISLYSLTQQLSITNIILDNSLSSKKRRELIKECKILGIPYYDVSEKGLFRINF